MDVFLSMKIPQKPALLFLRVMKQYIKMLKTIIHYGRMGKKGTETQFKRPTFHVPNLIAIWVYPIDKSLIIESYVKLKISRTQFIFKMLA